MRLDTLTGTKDIRSDGSMSLNGDITISTALQYRRHFLIVKSIFTHRGNLATAINALSNSGITLHSDCCVATHQCRVTVSLDTSTATKDATRDSRSCSSTFCSDSISNPHLSISLHSAYLTATIDILCYCAVRDVDIRAVGNTLLTPEGVFLTLTGSEHMALNVGRATNSHIANASVLVIGIGCSIVSAVSIFPTERSVVIRNLIYTHTAQLTTAIDIAIDGTTRDRNVGVFTHQSEFVAGRIDVTTGSTKDITIANRTANANRAATDVNGCHTTGSSTISICLTHRTHGTGTIDVADNLTAVDVDRRSTIYDTCQGVKGFFIFIIIVDVSISV